MKNNKKARTNIVGLSYILFMVSISVCMIVKNEAKILARCLDCVQEFADEIIIVDTGSRDKTKEIARQYTANVYDFEWCDDFSKARNFSFSFATSDYIMWLDADDYIDSQNCEKIRRLKAELNTLAPPDCVMAKYVTSPPPREFSYYRERLLRRESNFVWHEPVHEAIAPRGKIIYSEIEILHKKEPKPYSKRNLNIYKKMLKTGTPFSPRAKYYYARELYYNGIFHKSIRVFDEFLNDSGGWVENKIDACIIKSSCFMRISKPDKAKRAILQSFEFSAPRAKTICLLAEFLMQQKSYTTAIDWLKIALTLPTETSGWLEPDFHNYRPYLDLSICYYYLSNISLAKTYHNLAKSIHPDTPEIRFNEQFFVQ